MLRIEWPGYMLKCNNLGEVRHSLAPSPRKRARVLPRIEPLEARELLSNGPTWTPIGPAPIATGIANYSPITGRVSVAVPVPGSPNTMYIGSNTGGGGLGGGGIWRTDNWNDPSPQWTALTDQQPSLSIAEHGIAIFPGNSDIIYAAAQGAFAGILKSTDGGTSWCYLAEDTFAGAMFGGIVVHPTDSNMVYVAVSGQAVSGATVAGGVYVSTDGGRHWTNSTAHVHTGFVSDLILGPTADPASRYVLYAGFVRAASGSASTDGVWKSGPQVQHWVPLTNGLAPSEVGEFIRLAASPTTPDFAYALVLCPTNSATNPCQCVYRTSNGGGNWTLQAPIPQPQEYRYWHQGLAVDPSNANTVYVNGAYRVYRSTDEGMSWGTSFFNAEDPVDGAFDNTGAYIQVGDRGINRFPSPGTTFQPKAGNLQIALLYDISVNPANTSVAYTVSQDQLSLMKYTGSLTWNYLQKTSEVGRVIVNPAQPNTVYHLSTVQAGFFQVSTNAGMSWSSAATGIDSSQWPVSARFSELYYNALALDPSNGQHLVLGGTQVWQTTNGANSWSAISPVLSQSGTTPVNISAVAIAASNSNVIYAGTQDGKVFVNGIGATNWPQRDTGLPVTAAQVALDFEIDPSNASRAFVVLSGIGAATGGVWMTISGGQSWTNITGTIHADIEVWDLAADWRASPPVLYLASDQGVFVSTDLGGAWTTLGEGLPNTQVRRLAFLPASNLLVAATFGRGAFQTTVSPPGGPGLRSGATPPWTLDAAGAADLWPALLAFDLRLGDAVRVAGSAARYGVEDNRTFEDRKWDRIVTGAGLQLPHIEPVRHPPGQVDGASMGSFVVLPEVSSEEFHGAILGADAWFGLPFGHLIQD